jgi:hypothetical protein
MWIEGLIRVACSPLVAMPAHTSDWLQQWEPRQLTQINKGT